MSRWIEPRDVPWAAGRLARKAWERARPGSPFRIETGRRGEEIARRNIESVLAGDPGFPDVESIVRRHRDYARFRAPSPGSGRSSGPHRWPVVGREHLDAALSAGRGAILATAHLGWWLLVAPVLRLHGYPVIQTSGPYFERRRQARIERGRGQSRFRRFVDARSRPSGHLGPEDLAITLDVRPIFSALARNRPILIAGDGKRSLEFATFPLLGRPYALPIGFVKVAMAARCPVVPVFALEGERPGSVRVEVRQPLDLDPTASPVENLALYARVLDDQLRATPHLWSRWATPDPFDQRRKWAEGGYLAAAGGRERASAAGASASEAGKLPGSRSK
jgi:lauroyl/myristoyl acyltransferase